MVCHAVTSDVILPPTRSMPEYIAHIANNPLNYPPTKNTARSSWLRSQSQNSMARQHASTFSPTDRQSNNINNNKVKPISAIRSESAPSGQLLDSIYPLTTRTNAPSSAMLSGASIINEVEAATQLLESTWKSGEQFGVGSALPVSMGAGELDDVIGGFVCSTPPTPIDPNRNFDTPHPRGAASAHVEGEDTSPSTEKPWPNGSTLADGLFDDDVMLPPPIRTVRELRRSISTGNLDLAGGLNRMNSTKTFGGLPKVDEEGVSGGG